MKKIEYFQSVSGLALITLLTACGGGGSSGGSDDGSGGASGTTVTANVVKGPVSGASCELYSITAAGAQDTLLATGESSNGVVSFENISYTGNSLVSCAGGTYTDEATGDTLTAPVMRAVLEVSAETEITVTPLTEIAVASASDFNSVNYEPVANAFGLEGISLAEVRPTDFNTEQPENDGPGIYGLALAILSQYQQDQGIEVTEVINNLAGELADGSFSELNKSALIDAANNLSESAVQDAINEEVLENLIAEVQAIIDDTPPEVSFLPASLTIEVGESGTTSLSIVDGVLVESVICDAGISYTGGVVSGEAPGNFACTATAIDNNQLINSATLSLSLVDTTAPVITAPASVSIIAGESVSLDISADDLVSGEVDFIVDCGQDPVFYNSGSANSGTLFSQEAGEYACTISASDEQNNSASVDVSVSVVASGSGSVLIADAGEAFSAPTGSRVELDGGASTYGVNDTLSWTLSSKPANSNASLDSSSGVTTSFTPDIDGSYVIQLTVSDGVNTDSTSVTVSAVTQSWIISQEPSQFIDALVNVQSVESRYQLGENEFFRILSSGVPSYSVEMTQALINSLNNRPMAASDFDDGQTSALVGDVIEFGEDIGYNVTTVGCSLGYWPPGPACPSDQFRQGFIPMNPTPASAEDECDTSINTMGLMLNGTAVFNWSDGVSYNNEGVWRQLAPEFEIYDVDICSGHAQQQGNYHHHMFSSCLAELFGDEGQAHSPIYGYAADGYPLYGPYHAKGVLAQSAWVKRDYNDVNQGGCGTGSRTCVLADNTDLSQGTITTDSSGPDVDEVVTSNSGNEFTVESGYYFEDYYYDASLTALGGAYLDEHNGHDHDGLGYHYHTTVVSDNEGNLVPVFPYNIGPSFYGDAPGGSIYSCTPLP